MPETDIRHLEMLAEFDGVAVAEEIREAVKLLVDSRRNDPAFRERVRAAVTRGKALLEELGASDLASELG